MPEYGKFLTGQVMADHKCDSVVITIEEVRRMAQYDDRTVVDFTEPLWGEFSSVPLNTTNYKRLRRMLGKNWDEWAGQTIELRRYITRNPKTDKDAWGIYVEDGTGVPDFSALKKQATKDGPEQPTAKKEPRRFRAIPQPKEKK